VRHDLVVSLTQGARRVVRRHDDYNFLAV
jgi:hypothetical protein